MNIKIVIIICIVLYTVYKVYNSQIYELYDNIFNSKNMKKKDINFENDVANDSSTLYTDKHVSFNDNVDVREYLQNDRYSLQDLDILSDNNLNNIVDDLLKAPTIDYKTKLNDSFEPINNIDTNEMFNELENEINSKYENMNGQATSFYKMDRQPLSDNMLNSKDINMGTNNAAINPNCYKDIMNTEDGGTIWEKYDKMTSNNYKQYDKLDKLVPNELSPNSWTIGSNDKYGSQFDNYGE